jgi:hypothetical protein
MSDRETKSIASGGLCGYFKCIRYICHARSRLSSFQCPPTAAPVLSSVFKKRVGEAPVGRQASHRREVALPFHAFSSNRISFKSAACIQTQVDEGKRYGVMDLFGDLPPAAGEKAEASTKASHKKNAATFLKPRATSSIMLPPQRLAARPTQLMAPPQTRPRTAVTHEPIEVGLVRQRSPQFSAL